MNTEVISKKSFISVVVVLLCMVIISGILTRVLPMGSYDRAIIDGQVKVVSGSYKSYQGDRLPIYRWLTAPIEVLFSEDSLIIFVILGFLLVASGSISTLNHAGIIEDVIYKISIKYQYKPYILLSIISFFFMCLGSFIGIYEEIIPLIPLVIALITKLGFDKMTGLGVSLLACGLGFAAAISNPFTIGIAQQLAGLPIFSGALLRVVVFIITYIIFLIFVIRHAKRNKKKVEAVYLNSHTSKNKGSKFFIAVMAVMVILLISSAFIPFVRNINLILVALLFLFAAFSGSVASGNTLKASFRYFYKGMLAILPGVILILLAVSVKHIIVTGHIMDTILYKGSSFIINSPPAIALVYVYLLVLVLNFFIGSGSAKAFIVIPIVVPLLDMMNISRQLGVLAFQFGDGFSNIIYPTNAVLLIVLALTNTKLSNWIKWVLPIQLILAAMSIIMLVIGLTINY